MSNWWPDNSVQFADGTLACNAHHRTVCSQCQVDYRSAQQGPEYDEDYYNFPPPAPPSQQSPSPVVPVVRRFIPRNPRDTPQTLFPPDDWYYESFGFVHRAQPGHILVYTDGACLGNGQPSPSAGCAFVYRSNRGISSFRLEIEGPTGQPHPQTSNRAELRAVIAALEFLAWHKEGWTQVAIATDSEYVVNGVTNWVHEWIRNGWTTAQGIPVKNQDLWEELLEKILCVRDEGYHGASACQVVFWRINKEWNQVADQAAKEAAARHRGYDPECGRFG